MIVPGIPNALLFALLALGCLLLAVILLMLMIRHQRSGNTPPAPLWRQLLKGESLTEKGLGYRNGIFLALMFMFLNLVSSVVTQLATMTTP